MDQETWNRDPSWGCTDRISDLDDRSRLQIMCDDIAEQINCGMTYQEAELDHEERGAKPGDQITAFDWLEDALDIQYIVTGKGEYLGARILVAFGGPTIGLIPRKRLLGATGGAIKSSLGFGMMPCTWMMPWPNYGSTDDEQRIYQDGKEGDQESEKVDIVARICCWTLLVTGGLFGAASTSFLYLCF